MRARRTAFALLALLAAAPAASAQELRATITGRVTDGSGGALPGATVTVAPADGTAPPVVAITDGVGQYLTAPVPPGTYTVTVELTGFTPQMRPNVVVRAGDVFVLDQALTVAQLSESLEVVAAAPAVPPPVPPLKLQPPTKPAVRPSEMPMSVARMPATRPTMPVVDSVPVNQPVESVVSVPR